VRFPAIVAVMCWSQGIAWGRLALLPVAWWAMSFTLALGFLLLAVASTVPSAVAGLVPLLTATAEGI